MKKSCLLPAILALGALPAIAADQPAKTTALYHELHARQNADAKISLDVAAVRPIAPDVGFSELKFFHVITWDKRANRFGGSLVAVVPAVDAEKLVNRYGIYLDGYKPRKYGPETKKLTGTLRVTDHAHIYLDVSGTAKAVIGEREIPPRLWLHPPGGEDRGFGMPGDRRSLNR